MYRTLTNFVRTTNINNNSSRQISSLCTSDAYFSFSCIRLRDSILCSPWPWGISRHSFLLVNKVYLSFHRRMDSKEDPTLSDSAMITPERSDDTAGIIGKLILLIITNFWLSLPIMSMNWTNRCRREH